MSEDDELVERFEKTELEMLPHADHVRIAVRYLQQYGPELALERLVAGLTRFAAAKGHPDKFHYTLTRAWLELIVLAHERHPQARTAAELLGACPALLDARTIRRFYSAAVLATEGARLGWVGPDVSPLKAPL